MTPTLNSIISRPNLKPLRLLLEREFREAGLRLPVNLPETTSAPATRCRCCKAMRRSWLASIDVTQFCTRYGLMRILPVELDPVSEPCELVLRRGIVPSPAATLLIEQLTGGAAG